MRMSEIQQGIATGIGEIGQEVTKTELENQRRMSLRQISKHLSELGYLNERDKPYSAQSISDMVKQ